MTVLQSSISSSKYYSWAQEIYGKH